MMQRYGSGGNSTALFLLTALFIFLAPPLGILFLIMFLLD